MLMTLMILLIMANTDHIYYTQGRHCAQCLIYKQGLIDEEGTVMILVYPIGK